jgi:hypothetical protein
MRRKPPEQRGDGNKWQQWNTKHRPESSGGSRRPRNIERLLVEEQYAPLFNRAVGMEGLEVDRAVVEAHDWAPAELDEVILSVEEKRNEIRDDTAHRDKPEDQKCSKPHGRDSTKIARG